MTRSGIYFAEELEDQLAALEKAIEMYPEGEIRLGALLAIELFRTMLGLPAKGGGE